MSVSYDNFQEVPKEPVKLVENMEDLRNYFSNYKVVIVDVFAKWCNPCTQLYPLYEKFAIANSQNKNIIFLKDDIDNEVSPHREKVSAVPMFFFYINGQVAHTISGNDFDDFERTINHINYKLNQQN